MDTLATDVLRELKRKELKNRILIIIISIFFLLVTNAIWFIRWNAPPKQKEEEKIMQIINDGNDGDDGNDTSQSNNEKSK